MPAPWLRVLSLDQQRGLDRDLELNLDEVVTLPMIQRAMIPWLMISDKIIAFIVARSLDLDEGAGRNEFAIKSDRWA